MSYILRLESTHRFIWPDLGMGHHQKGLAPPQDAPKDDVQGFGIERRETLVKHANIRMLRQGARNAHPGPLPLGELPATVADHLLDAGGHAR